MSTYVIGDIHGCYDELLKMLDKICFTGADHLILAGDYIDRGTQSLHMLHWLEDCPGNVTPIRGNHDEEFCFYVDLMEQIDRQCGLRTKPDARDEAAALYSTVVYLLKNRDSAISAYFDHYGTVAELLRTTKITLHDLKLWRDMIRAMPLFLVLSVGGRRCVVVHGGYREDLPPEDPEAVSFFLYAREEAWKLGGIRHGMIVAGHTPTVARGSFAFNNGRAARYYDRERDCVFYDIDCGCVFRPRHHSARLCCLRLEDETLFYV